ncbi:endonuclease III [Flavobacteriaceae bacterium]|nr:endonuclease III [Flavobacteriaceae bacterium]
MKCKINKIFSILSQKNPKPKTELYFTNNYTLLVAVVLSAQSTDIGVNKATKTLFKIVDTAQKMLDLGEERLKQYIKTIGLFNSKAKNIISLSRKLISDFDSEIPQNIYDLQSLAGVGRKTANVVLNCAFGFPTIGVDTHVFRVSNRLGIAEEKNVLKTELALNKNIPEKWKKYAHHWLILHGRYICTAKKPKCYSCEISHLCCSFVTNIISKN